MSCRVDIRSLTKESNGNDTWYYSIDVDEEYREVLYKIDNVYKQHEPYLSLTRRGRAGDIVIIGPAMLSGSFVEVIDTEGL